MRLTATASIDSVGRIWFPGNPYPLGHLLEELIIRAELGSETLKLVFDIVSDDYSNSSEATDPDELVPAWQSPGTWSNYGFCNFYGTVARTPELEPIDFTKPIALVIDPMDGDDAERYIADLAFTHSYILGPTPTADHELELAPNGDGTFQVQWAGRVGSPRLDHFFWVEHAALPSIRFEVKPAETNEAEARRWLAHFVVDADKFEYDDGVFKLK